MNPSWCPEGSHKVGVEGRIQNPDNGQLADAHRGNRPATLSGWDAELNQTSSFTGTTPYNTCLKKEKKKEKKKKKKDIIIRLWMASERLTCLTTDKSKDGIAFSLLKPQSSVG